MQQSSAADIAHLIQLAVAPVFLLAGIGSMLNVLVQRLARVVDRARRIESDFGSLEGKARERAVGSSSCSIGG